MGDNSIALVLMALLAVVFFWPRETPPSPWDDDDDFPDGGAVA